MVGASVECVVTIATDKTGGLWQRQIEISLQAAIEVSAVRVDIYV